MKNLMIAAALCLGTASAQAQGTTPAAKGSDCLAATTGQVWEAIGLSAEQVKKVAEIQKGAAKAAAPSAESQLKAALTPDQFEKWSAWCAGRDQGKPVPEGTQDKE